MDTPRIELPIAARLAIRELIDRYSDAIHQHDWVGLANLFAPDAVWEVSDPVNLRFESSAKIAGGLRWSVGRQEFLFQQSSSIVLTALGPDRALVRSTMIEISRARGAQLGSRTVGTQFDEVLRRAATWYFKHRTFRIRYRDTLALPGELYDPPLAFSEQLGQSPARPKPA